MPGDAALPAGRFDQLLAVREQVARVLEPMRAAGTIGAALEAEVTLRCGAVDHAWLAPLADELRFLLISGDVAVEAGASDGIEVLAVPTGKAKCVRCWQHRGDIGVVPAHPLACGRCATNVDGPGETRRWF